MSYYDEDEYYGDWYNNGVLMEDPADWYHDLDSPFDPIDDKYEPDITDRDWPIGIKSGEHKWVYMVTVAKQSAKIGSCNPSIKHLKIGSARLNGGIRLVLLV